MNWVEWWPRLGGDSLRAPSLVVTQSSPSEHQVYQFPSAATTHSVYPRLSLHTKDLGEVAQQGTILQDLFEDTMSPEPNSFQIHVRAVEGKKERWEKELANSKITT